VIKAANLLGSPVVDLLQSIANVTVKTFTNVGEAVPVDLSKVNAAIAKPEDPNA
jgi:hypothetical protein